MTRIVDFIFLIFAAFLGKKALLLSVFAFAPSVLANDIPLATLSVDNIQVRAEWNVVGDSANHFSVEGGTLMLKPGAKAGNTFIATVEVRDKFSTLNPNYEDLATTVMITAVIIGCPTDEWTRNFAKAKFPRNGGDPPNQIAVESGAIKVGDVIARRYTANGYNHIYLYTVNVIAGHYQAKTYITTDPSLYGHLTKFDAGVANPGYTSFPINESGYCFAEEVETSQEQNQILQEKTDYLNVHAPLITGFYAGVGRTVTVANAFVYNNQQFFWLNNVTLANILNEIYTPKVIIDNGKAYSIADSFPSGNRYEYFANNITVAADGTWNGSPHEVIVLNRDCPTVYTVTATKAGPGASLIINTADVGKVKGYVLFQGKVYKSGEITDGGNASLIDIHGFDENSLGSGTHILKYADHFLCGTG